MNKRFLVYTEAVVLVVIVIGSVVWFADSNRPPSGTAGQKQRNSSALSADGGADPSPSPPVASGGTNAASLVTKAAPSVDNTTGKAVLQGMFKILGLKPMAPPKQYLQEAIATRDNVKISRAFHDMVYAGSPPGEVISALKDVLGDSNPFVRYLAAEYLFIVGDQSGYDTLLALVQANMPINGIGVDVRIEAAETLAQFRQTNAAQAICDLYQQTKSGVLISALATLGSPQAAELTEARGYFTNPSALIFYGKTGASEFIPRITSTYNGTQDPDVKAAAAWALATMTGDESAMSYLVQAVQTGLNNPSQASSVSLRDVVSYLGSIQTPEAKQTLEAALSSSNPQVVQVAALNLIFNQGGSEKVNHMVASELTGPPNPLGLDMALNLAPQMINDPEVQAAGQFFSQHDGLGAWERATVARRNWSTYNWMSEIYIAKPNKK